MRILQVVTRLGMGGAERVAESLSIGLVARGWDVTFIPIGGARDRAVADRMRESLVAAGVDVAAGASVSNAKVAAVEAAVRLARTVERVRPDLVHLHTEIPEFAWALAGLGSSRVRGVPVVRTVHNTVLWGGWSGAGRFAERRLAQARVAAVSDAARRGFADWLARAGRPPADLVVIRNGIDMDDLAGGPGEPNEPPLLCFAGRFEPQKGVDILIDCLAHVVDGGRPFRLAMHGAGTLDGEVAQAARRWSPRITVGPPMADLRSHLDLYDAILMPSRFEGMPLLAIEALCTGIPLLATDAPGLAEVVPAWYAGRCPPGDSAAYAAVVQDFLEQPAAWRAQAARARAEARPRFSLDSMLAAYQGLYADAVS